MRPPRPSPDGRRLDVVMTEGRTISEIVAANVGEGDHSGVRVILSTPAGSMVITREAWGAVRPKAGVRVTLHVPPTQGNALRTVLMIVVAIAAIATGQLWGAALGKAIGVTAATGTTIATTAVMAVGMLAVNALVPVRLSGKSGDDRETGGYSIQGFRNSPNPDGPIPVPFGRHRVAPYYAAPPYTEIVGDVQYIRAAFIWGYGPLKITDLRLGETPITDFDLEIEHREGWAGDTQLTLYPSQVIEEGLAVDLTRSYPRNEDGSLVSGGTPQEKAVIRTTATDVSEIAVILGFPGGLCSVGDSGSKLTATVSIRIRYRRLGTTNWSTVTTTDVSGATTVPIWRQLRWRVPVRGAYEVELTRMTPESLSSQTTDRSTWQALQSIRPEYPIAVDRPVAVTAVCVKATYQLNGTLDNLNGITSRVAWDWDTSARAWVLRETRSPAAAYLWMLRGPATALPAADGEIDFGALADWSEWCAAQGLFYDRIHDQEGSLADALADATAAGRAAPRHDGRRWTVVIDRPAALIVDHINQRNSRSFRWKRSYPKRPDGFRISFPDATNDWKKGERIVPWIGHTGPIVVTEELQLPGKTDPAEIWREARRRMLEIEHRPDTFEVIQDGLARVATRGDTVIVAHDVLSRVLVAARVMEVGGGIIRVDEAVDLEGGIDWAIRFRVFGIDDPIGTSVVRALQPAAGGPTHLLRPAGIGELPLIDDLVHIGPLGSEELLAIVRGEERAEDNAVLYHLVAAAPEIDEILAADIAPTWDGRAGAAYTGGALALTPAVPRMTVRTGYIGTGVAGGLQIGLQPGQTSSAVVDRFEVQTRPHGATGWSAIVISQASGGISVPDYEDGDTVDIRARAISFYGVGGAWSDVATVVIGDADTTVPNPISLSVTSAAMRGFAFAMAAGVTVHGFRLRARPGSGWSWSRLSPLHTGYLTASPWNSASPRGGGTYTVGVIAIDQLGIASRSAFVTEVILPGSAGARLTRFEAALGWPGTTSGGSVVGDEIVGDAPPSVLTYVMPTIDLGANIAVDLSVECWCVEGAAVVTMRTGLVADGGPTGTAQPIGPATCRYIQIIVTVTNDQDAARLGDVSVEIV